MGSHIFLVKTATLGFAALFPIVNPLGSAPIFFGLTHRYPVALRHLLAQKIAFFSFMILVVCLLFGTAILDFFGVSLPVVQMAGGLLLASTGWNMLNKSATSTDGSAQKPEQITLQAALENAFYPLTFPITVGPGCIAIAITIGAHLKQQSRTLLLDELPLFLAAALGMMAVCLLVWLCYRYADRLVKRLGAMGADIVVRFSSFILLAIGVQIAWNGLSQALDPLLHAK